MRKFFLYFISIICFSTSTAAVYIKKSNETIYIRTPFDNVYDKVWRFRAGPQIAAYSTGVFDCLSERLIPKKTPIPTTISIYNTSSIILRNSMDESPPIWINDEIIIGGNHTLKEKSTISGYDYNIVIDGITLPINFDSASGDSLVLNESYKAHNESEIPLVKVSNSLHFSSKPLIDFSFKVKALQHLDFLKFGGIQFQHIPVTDMEHAIFYISETISSAGLDVTKTGDIIDIFSPEDVNKGKKIYTVSIFNSSSQNLLRQFLFTYTTDVNVPSDYPIIKISKLGKIYPTFAKLNNFPLGSVITASGEYGFVPIQSNYKDDAQKLNSRRVFSNKILQASR